MTCDVCGKVCIVERFTFYEGTPEHPSRVWFIDAPRYFKASPDRMSCEVPFCGAPCAVAYYRANV